MILISPVRRRYVRRRLWRLQYLTRRVAEEIWEHNIFGFAAQLAFYFLLSVFPFLLLLATLVPYFAAPAAFDHWVSVLQPIVPTQVMSLVMGNLHTLLTQKREGLLSFSALTLLWSASSGFGAMMDGLNSAYRARESRPFLRARLMAVALTLLLGLLVLVSIVLLIFGELLNDFAAYYLALPVTFWIMARWAAAVLSLILVLDVIYYAAPNVRHPWRWLSPGALVATPAWVALSLALSYYISRFGRYEATYGALAAVISLMLWFYISAVVMLVGGNINSVLEREILHEAQAIAPAPPRTT